MWDLEADRIQIIKISPKYTKYLRDNIDSKIPLEHNEKHRLPRPFIGVLITSGEHKYVIPLSSPKPKHLKMKNMIDFMKIDGGKLGAINFNNMFPIVDNPTVYSAIDTGLSDDLADREYHYIKLIRMQLTWLNIHKNKQAILLKAQNLRDMYRNGELDERVRVRCCNFVELEERYTEYEI